MIESCDTNNTSLYLAADFSTLGRQEGIRNLRGQLVFRIITLAGHLGCQALILENVEGLLRHSHIRDVAECSQSTDPSSRAVANKTHRVCCRDVADYSCGYLLCSVCIGTDCVGCVLGLLNIG